MRKMKVTAIVLLGLCALALAPTARGGEARESDTFHVLSYDIQVRPDFTAKAIAGTERIRFKSLIDGLSAISFTANALEVTASIGDEVIASEVAGDRRIFHLVTPLHAGQVAVITFSLKGSAPKGLVFAADTVYANYFTCDVVICDQDRPGDKAPVAFALVLPQGMDAVAPGTLQRRTKIAGGMELWQWRERRPTAPYLLGFAAGKYERVALPGARPALGVLTSGEPADRVRAMFADTRRMLAFFEEKSGVPFDAQSYTQVLVKGDEAQEAASHSLIGSDEIEPILTDPQEDWVIAHELAHQWWGNSLTCADWSELWLNEGLTVFMVAAYKELRWGRAAYDRELDLANKRWAAAKTQGFDVPLSWQGKYPSLKLKRAMAYAKSVVFLDKLRTELGETAFWRAIKSYTRAHRSGVVTAIDLEHAFEESSGRNLSPLFAEWVFGKP
jgi:hypothetical protein